VAPWYPSSVEIAACWCPVRHAVEETDGSHPGLDLEHRRQAWRPCSVRHGEGDPLHEERLRFLKKANRNNRLSIDALLATGYEFLYGNEPDVITGVQRPSTGTPAALDRLSRNPCSALER